MGTCRRSGESLARSLRGHVACVPDALPMIARRVVRTQSWIPNPETFGCHAQAPLRASAPLWLSPPLSVLSVFSVAKLPLSSLSRPFFTVPESFQPILECSQRLLRSYNDLFGPARDDFGASPLLFGWFKDLCCSSQDIFYSSKDLIYLSKDLIHLSKDLFHSPKDLFRSSKDISACSQAVPGSAAGLINRARNIFPRTVFSPDTAPRREPLTSGKSHTFLKGALTWPTTFPRPTPSSTVGR